MSEEEKNESGAPSRTRSRTPKKRIVATLKRGNTYTYNGKTFKRGTPTPVTEEERSHLEENAIDRVSYHSSEGVVGEDRPKFEFAEEASE